MTIAKRSAFVSTRTLTFAALVAALGTGCAAPVEGDDAVASSHDALTLTDPVSPIRVSPIVRGGGRFDIIVKIPETEVCTANDADKATCYENFCKAQQAGHYQADTNVGAACVSN